MVNIVKLVCRYMVGDSLKGCCWITELELFHGFFYDTSSVNGRVLYVLG